MRDGTDGSSIGTPVGLRDEPGGAAIRGRVVPLCAACGTPASSVDALAPSPASAGMGGGRRFGRGTTVRAMNDCVARVAATVDSVLRRAPDCDALADGAFNAGPDCDALAGGASATGPDWDALADGTFSVPPDCDADGTLNVLADGTFSVPPDWEGLVVGGAVPFRGGVAMGPETSSPRRSPHPSSMFGGFDTRPRCCH